MTPEAWEDYDGPRMEKLRHRRKYHGHGGPPHKPLRGMVASDAIGMHRVLGLIHDHHGKTRKSERIARELEEDARAIAKRKRREAQG